MARTRVQWVLEASRLMLHRGFTQPISVLRMVPLCPSCTQLVHQVVTLSGCRLKVTPESLLLACRQTLVAMLWPAAHLVDQWQILALVLDPVAHHDREAIQCTTVKCSK